MMSRRICKVNKQSWPAAAKKIVEVWPEFTRTLSLVHEGVYCSRVAVAFSKSRSGVWWTWRWLAASIL
ncbi:hypothetical protein BGW80DRAFT_1394972 [Lactifluus volemus]|nr:hypothetical protein BGW80DRAFT_1394972 [Lactifluus volemus]